MTARALGPLGRASSWLAAMCALCLLALSPAVHAQSGRRFQQYVSQGQQAYENGDGDGAVRALIHAYEIRAVPVLLFNIGRAYELGGHLASAIEYYDRFLQTNPDADAAQTARDTREAARVALAAREHPVADTTNTGDTTTSAATPHPAATTEQGRHFAVGHGVVIGTGAVGLIVGGVLGALALSASTQFQSTLDPTQRADLQDRGGSYALGADVALGLGIVAVAAGFIAYLLQDAHPSARPTATATTWTRRSP